MSAENLVPTSHNTHQGKTALHLAAENGWSSSIRLILNRTANADSCDSAGRTALHLAAKNGHVKVVQEILSTCHRKKVQFNINARDSDGMTVLHYAAANGGQEIIEILLKEADIDVDAKTM